MPVEYRIDQVRPSALFGVNEDVDATVRHILARYEPALHRAETDDYNLNRFRSAAFNFVPLLLSLGLDLRRLTMLEVGCGRGLKGLAFSDIVGRYIGIDLDPHEINLGRLLRRESGRDPGELVLGDAVRLLARGGEFKVEEVDILVLYAVLEHLTPHERRQMLALARTVYDRGGMVIVAETPNRLFPFDHHSSQRHFLQMLPDELARRHLEKFSDHPVRRFVVGVDPTKQQEMLYRSGRALSFHDFELDFCPGELDLRPVADGYHPCLVNLQPIARAELDLLSYFRANNIRVPRCFSRSWLDMVLVKSSSSPAPSTVSLIPPSQMDRAQRNHALEFWNTDAYTIDSGGSVTFDQLPCGAAQLLLDVPDTRSGIEITADNAPIFHATGADLQSWRPPTWHTRFAVPVRVASGVQRLTVRAQAGSSGATVFGLLVDSA